MGLLRRISPRSRKCVGRNRAVVGADACPHPASAFDYLDRHSAGRSKPSPEGRGDGTPRPAELVQYCYPVSRAAALSRRAAPRDRRACAARGTGSPSCRRRCRARPCKAATRLLKLSPKLSSRRFRLNSNIQSCRTS